jgi:hypothetical protein
VPFLRPARGARRRAGAVFHRRIWITAEPLAADEAEEALRRAGLDVAAALRKGSLVIRDHLEWYAESGILKGSEVAELWLAEERDALAGGYSGLRITGNTSFLTPATWDLFMEYEATIDRAFADRRIVTLCSYRLGQCKASGVLDVVRRHGCTLDRPDEGWQLLTSRPSRQDLRG